ncbi:MAG: hypothetical protein KAH23_00165 [Kiritimatiellae bacterium]|nr:hypothetical protein [Kiritimatiellia bacterium]
MKRTVCGVCMMLVLCGVIFGQIGLGDDAERSAGKMDKQAKPPTEEQKMLLRYVAFANAYRVLGSADPDKANDKFGTKKFKKSWTEDAGKIFNNKTEKTMLRDFFSSSVVLVGRASKKKAVACFYSPWLDTLLLVGMRHDDSDVMLEEYRFVAGESWREEKVTTGEQLLSLYIGSEPLVLALAKRYDKTVSIFNANYPLDDWYRFIPRKVRKRIGTTGEEAAPMLARRFCRVKMYRNYFSKEKRAVMLAVRELQERLKKGDPTELKKFLSAKQDQEMLKTICMLPSDLRGGVATVYFAESGDSGIVALVGENYPRWIFVLEMANIRSKKPEVTNIDVMDLEISSKLMKAEKGGV